MPHPPAPPAPPSPSAATGAAAGIALVVDDHPLVRAAIAELIESFGYRVVEAETGEAAARLLGGGLDIDLLVTDQLMPGMNGIELAGLARARRPGLPVLIVSGAAGPDDLPPGMLWLAKPFRKAELQDCLARFARTAGDAPCLPEPVPLPPVAD